MKCIVRKSDSFINIPADRIVNDEGIVFVYDGEKLVGAFDLGSIDYIYLSGAKQ